MDFLLVIPTYADVRKQHVAAEKEFSGSESYKTGTGVVESEGGEMFLLLKNVNDVNKIVRLGKPFFMSF